METNQSPDAQNGPGSPDMPIDGGEITDLDSNLPEFDPARHRAETASRLAFWLLGILIGTGIVHYGAIVVLGWKGQKDTVQTLMTIFNSWLPVIAGFVGGAVTYYFTKEARR